MIETILNATWGEILLVIFAIGFTVSFVGAIYQQVWPILKKELNDG